MEKGQSKRKSFLEAISNTAVGFIITFVISPLIYSLVGMEYNIQQLGMVTVLFTIASILRGYIIRRFFNNEEKNNDEHLISEITKLKETLRVEREQLSRWSDLHKSMRNRNFKLKEELDMCKYLHTAAVSDLVEGAIYIPAEIPKGEPPILLKDENNEDTQNNS